MDIDKEFVKEKIKDVRFEKPTFIDPLTGLFNQYYLYQFLPEEIEKAKLGAHPVAVLMLDLDGFKEINDTYGHLSGDAILKQLAGIIKKSVRQNDMIIRYAGDEFTIILPAASRENALSLSNKLIENISKNVFQCNAGQNIHLTISAGLAVCPDDSDKLEDLIALADKALYFSKQKGKNKVSHIKEVSLESISHLVAMDSFPCAKFIDRTNELARLKQLFYAAVMKSNLLQTVFVSGETGIGKTRFISEIQSYVQNDAIIISARASLKYSNDPYHLFIKGISAYMQKSGKETSELVGLLFRLPQEELAVLSRIIPFIAELVHPPEDMGIDDKRVRILLFKGFLDLLLELNKSSALVIFIEDINWADKASMEILRYLTKQEKDKKIFIVCSFMKDKSNQAEVDNDFKNLLEDIRFNENFVHIELTDFALADTFSMIDAIFCGIGKEREFCELIHDITKGNPSFIEEILKSLVENGVIFYQDNRWQIKLGFSSSDIPVTMEDAVRRRLKNLDAETKEMIVQAAVIGDDFSADFLKKINNKDEGFMLDILNRAKKMRLVEELGTEKTFGFINKNMQNMLYNELNDAQRNKLHYKIGQKIAEEHKNNLYNVAGEVAFHLGKLPRQNKLEEFNTTLLEKTSQIFRPYEIIEYLDKLAKDVITEDSGLPAAAALGESMFKESLKFVLVFQRALKSFRLYPEGRMRSNIVNEAYSILSKIWDENPCLNLAEMEKSLVINSRRLSSKDIGEAHPGDLLDVMMDHNLKMIYFSKGLSCAELERFISYLVKPYADIFNKGGWGKIIREESFNGIKINEVSFVQMGAGIKDFQGKKKIEDIMLMEFLLGKIQNENVDRRAFVDSMRNEPKRFAQTIMDATDAVLRGGKCKDEAGAISDTMEKINSQIFDNTTLNNDYAKDMARVIMELRPALRSKVIRSQFLEKDQRRREMADDIVKEAPEEVVVEVIIEDYKENHKNTLVVKNYIDNILVKHPHKEAILLKLETGLSKHNTLDEEIAFIKGESQWTELSIEKRIDDIISLPDKYYKSELGKIRILLEDLESRQNKKELVRVLYHLIAKSGQPGFIFREDLIKLISDFLKTPLFNNGMGGSKIEAGLDTLLERLKIETDIVIFKTVLGILKEIVNDLSVNLYSIKAKASLIENQLFKKYSLFIQRLFAVLLERLEWEKERNGEICEIIKKFYNDISCDNFLQLLVYSLIYYPLQDRRIELKYIMDIIGDKIIDSLINIEIQEFMGFGDPFREYVIKKKITDLLNEFGDSAVNRLKQRLSQIKESDISPVFIELIGNLKKEEFVGLLLTFVKHQNPFVRQAVIQALGSIDGEKSQEAIHKIIKQEKDKRLAVLAKSLLKKITVR